MSRSSWWLVLVVALMTTLVPRVASAHGRDTSYSSWTLDTERRAVELRVRIAARELDRLGGPDALVEALAVSGCTLEPEGPSQGEALGGEALVTWRSRCDEEIPSEVELQLFEQLGPAHLHIARVRVGAGAWSTKQVLTASETGLVLDGGAEGPAQAWAPRFVRLGFAHILEGWDHLAFVFALLLGAASLGRVAVLITGFTLGHSFSLALAALGLARPEPGLVELLIAASIVVVAARTVEDADEAGCWTAEQVGGAFALLALAAAFGSPARALVCAGTAGFAWAYLRLGEGRPMAEASGSGRLGGAMALVAGFGLVHGAGFAGVLEQVGLSEGARVGSLLAFNLGVELGQLVFVALAWPLLSAALKRWPVLRTWGALALAGVGMAALCARALA